MNFVIEKKYGSLVQETEVRRQDSGVRIQNLYNDVHSFSSIKTI